MNVTPPPAISSYQELVQLRDRLSQAVLVAVDLENVDHFHSHYALSKLSEVGLAYADMRRLPPDLQDCTMTEVADSIMVHHWLVDEWRWVTDKTCPAFWHKKKPHTARPYDCQFMCTRQATSAMEAMQAMGNRITDIHADFEIRDYDGELERPQEVIVLFWAADLEKRTMEEAELRQVMKNPWFQFWDLQKWYPIWYRWNRAVSPHLRKSQASCGDFLHSVGISDTDIKLHNAGNDAYAELLGFCRFLKQTEEEFDSWMKAEALQTTIKWNEILKSDSFYQDNQKLGQRFVHSHVHGSTGNGWRGGRQYQQKNSRFP